MLLGGDDLAALPGSLEDDVLIQRLDGVDVDDAGVDALGGQGLGGLAGLVDHQAGSHDGNITALGELLALADLEVIVGLVVEHGNRQTAKAKVDRTLHLVGGADSSACFHVVGGADDGHAGQAAHEGKVLAALVGSAVLTDGDAAVGSADLHVQVGVGHGVADLLKGTARSEHRKAGHEGNIAHGGQAGGDAHHVGLGDAAVKVAVRVSLAEHTGLGSGSEVGVQDHQVVVALSGQCFQSIAVALAGSDHFHICHLTCPPVPARRRLRSAPAWPQRTPRRWGLCRANPQSWS